MIRITHGQSVQGDTALSVVTATGDYEDTALIECAAGTGAPVVAYQAQYVRYGNVMYQHSDPVELGRALLAIDPDSTHAAASYVRMSDELLAKMNAGSLEPDSLDSVIRTEQAATEEERDVPAQAPNEATAPSIQQEAPLSVPTDTAMSSTTPEALVPSTEATSTTPAASVESLPATESLDTIPALVPVEATSTPEALRKGGIKLARRGARSRG